MLNLDANASNEFLCPGYLSLAKAKESSIMHMSSRVGYLDEASLSSWNYE